MKNDDEMKKKAQTGINEGFIPNSKEKVLLDKRSKNAVAMSMSNNTEIETVDTSKLWRVMNNQQLKV